MPSKFSELVVASGFHSSCNHRHENNNI